MRVEDNLYAAIERRLDENRRDLAKLHREQNLLEDARLNLSTGEDLRVVMARLASQGIDLSGQMLPPTVLDAAPPPLRA